MNPKVVSFIFIQGESATCPPELGKIWKESVERVEVKTDKGVIKMVNKLKNCTYGLIIYNLNSSRIRFSWVQAVTKIKKKENNA